MNAKIVLLLLSLPFLYGSCSTDFDVTADAEDIPLVYGLLSKNDSIHYIRIQRVYLIEGDALEAAQVNDSIYYDDELAVTLTRLSNNQVFNLNRVNGTDVNMPKDPGIFSNEPNWLYRFEGFLNEDGIYRLDINNENTGASFSAETNLVKQFNINMSPNFPLSFVSMPPAQAAWSAAENARTFDMSMVIPYIEWDISDPSNTVQKSVEWTVFTEFRVEASDEGARLTEDIEGERFYAFMRDNIEADPDKFRRLDSVIGIKVRFHAGGTIFNDYVRVREAQLGLLSNEFLPNYTNVEGGLGIVSSRLSLSREGFLLTRSSVDTLACGSISGDLNFMNSQGEFSCN